MWRNQLVGHSTSYLYCSSVVCLRRLLQEALCVDCGACVRNNESTNAPYRNRKSKARLILCAMGLWLIIYVALWFDKIGEKMGVKSCELRTQARIRIRKMPSSQQSKRIEMKGNQQKELHISSYFNEIYNARMILKSELSWIRLGFAWRANKKYEPMMVFLSSKNAQKIKAKNSLNE